MYSEDQTVLRSLYSTKLKRYGDEVERIIELIFSLYAMWKVPFDLSGSSEDMQQIVDIDKAIRDLSESALLMAVIIHQIINSNLDSSIRSEAVNLSLQILHQTPKFTAHGLYKLNHEVLLEVSICR
ncbi:gustatory receptor 67 [Danaus plexippus plexippus]|uniref:Gustatory receptor 67 n=1 Tax=Danaus plexippus plexippus TaxID=278856 RepID=A0A212EGW6_DANPL|nr:gustatory receptor 67 [Danaus plexippus plexippus]